MTIKKLNEYYIAHQDTYMSLARSCTSVPEIFLKLDIYGKHWCKWDWVMFFAAILNCMIIAEFNGEPHNNTLYYDIIYSIDNSTDMDHIITNKQILLSIIYTINSDELKFCTKQLRLALCKLLAHIFKKFPSLWNMNWMFQKYKNIKTKHYHRYHRMKSKIPYDRQIDNEDNLYSIFIQEYFNAQI